ncbi:hypothetical protein MIND_00217700 [Mycena indigotica]|uniref:Uncharacterized protein n=1 Tax=Mycena indigotica TaxID=2126181 RepID=A0A8H6T8A6_9AGAR|nr:uncharacterized protein MIND_00217700 [Mycena indigotica]KAF7312056.1 hypothetical protein MIND_00217700 [Mycena indigotica]
MDRQSLSYALHEPPRPPVVTSTPPQRHVEVAAGHTQAPLNNTAQPVTTTTAPIEKRKPGRPKGSKSKKVTVASDPPTTPDTSNQTIVETSTAGKDASTDASPLPVNAQNKQYYEFQWRILNLCHEFYGAAEELVKSTPPLVIAQCYQMGPSSKLDPLVLLNEAKQICDALLANPTKLISNPPPPMYTAVPTFYQPQVAPVTAPAPPTSIATSTSTSSPKPPSTSAPKPMPSTSQSTTTSQPPATTVITNPGSFVVSLGSQQYAYPATAIGGPYYAYPTYPGFLCTRYNHQHQQLTPSTVNILRSTTEYGVLCRHQILLKASAMGLKESGSRPKRRREETTEPPPNPPPPNPGIAVTASKAPVSASTPSNATLGSPAMSNATAPTPIASPAMQNLQHPVPAPKPNSMPWPMPTVAAPTISPVLSPSPLLQSHGPPAPNPSSGSTFYRPRPTPVPENAVMRHTFVYHNGTK